MLTGKCESNKSVVSVHQPPKALAKVDEDVAKTGVKE